MQKIIIKIAYYKGTKCIIKKVWRNTKYIGQLENRTRTQLEPN